MSIHFSELTCVKINNELYQIKKIEFEDEAVFQVTYQGQVYCLIMLNEHDEWKPDFEMPESLFTELMHWINKLYLEKQSIA